MSYFTFYGGQKKGQRNKLEQDPVAFYVENKELFVIYEPPGCGHADFVRLSAGIATSTGEEITLDGRVISGDPPAARQMALILPGTTLYPALTVRENMAYGLIKARIPADEVDRRVARIADLLALTPLMDTHPGALSPEQNFLVLLGRAAVREPKMILFDNPLQGFSSEARAALWPRLRAAQKSFGTAWLWGTSDAAEAAYLGDRVGIVRDGLFEQTAPPQELLTVPVNVYVAGSFGSPPMNLLEGVVQCNPDGSQLAVIPGDDEPACLSLPDSLVLKTGQDVVVGIAPDDTRILRQTPSCGAPALKATVESTLYVGGTPYVRLTAGDHLLARYPDGEPPQPGDTAWICLPTDPICVFDFETGQIVS